METPLETILTRENQPIVERKESESQSTTEMPHDLPHGKTAHHSFRKWTQAGIWEPIMVHLRKRVRTQMDRNPEPSAAIIDSQSTKTVPIRGTKRGFDARKNLWAQTPYPD